MNRNYGLDVLRIVSMLLIIMHHYTVHGGFTWAPDVISANKVFIQYLSAGGKIGVNCFILITGYYLIGSTFKLDKLFKLVFIVLFYSASFYLIAVATGYNIFNIKEAMASFLPVLSNRYWFVTSYIFLYILSPYINSLLKAIGRARHIRLVLLLVTIWSVLLISPGAQMNFSPIGWFILLYIIGAYIKLYPNRRFDYSKLNIILFLYAYAAIFLLVLLSSFLGTRIDSLSIYTNYFIAMNIGMSSLPVLFCSITLFLGFKSMKIIKNKFIVLFSSSTFGVYLIHDNPIARSLLWLDIFRNNSFSSSYLLIFHAILAILSVFIISVLIDQSVNHLFEIASMRGKLNIPATSLKTVKYLNPKIKASARKALH